MSIVAQSIGRTWDPYQIREPIYMKWEEYIKAWASTAPEGLNVIFHTADHFWAWLESEKAMYNNAV